MRLKRLKRMEAGAGGVTCGGNRCRDTRSHGRTDTTIRGLGGRGGYMRSEQNRLSGISEEMQGQTDRHSHMTIRGSGGGGMGGRQVGRGGMLCR